MDARERLRQIIDLQQTRLRAEVPAGSEVTILAILRAREDSTRRSHPEPLPDLITGSRLADPGGNLALRLCLEATDGTHSGASASDAGIDRWASSFLVECGQLAEAELVLTHVESGFLSIVADGKGDFAAWIATKRAPASWRERADIAWWASWLAERHEMPSNAPRERDLDDAHAHHVADVHLKRMAYQLAYPADATIGGVAVRTFHDVLRSLIARALQAHSGGEAAGSWPEPDLTADLAARLGVDPAVVGRAVASFTLDRENAAWHAAVPGIAAAPLVRVSPDRAAWSVYGLTTEPFFFLMRELRRRDPQEYNNRASLREDVFRQDLYALFADRRFVTSRGQIALRRAGGDLRTDIDAVVFDRKTGTLGLFELKSHDPFARSSAELARQCENLFYANRQLSGVLTWLNRHSPDALLSRVDAQTAKRFRVQKVYPFVLGRYLASCGGGPEPDRRAAWGNWPGVLRLLDGQPVSAAANPIASLHARLAKDAPFVSLPADAPAREVSVGGVRLTVYASFSAFRASSGRTVPAPTARG